MFGGVDHHQSVIKIFSSRMVGRNHDVKIIFLLKLTFFLSFYAKSVKERITFIHVPVCIIFLFPYVLSKNSRIQIMNTR